jgi:magnesium-transporting ATPase (P-type)
MDDNFNSIVAAIMWGRAVYDNIRKFVQFQATMNVVAMSIAVIGALAGFGEPLTAVQLLWVNLIMDTFAALALGTEEPQRDMLLSRRPYSPDAFIISPVMARNIAGQSVYQIIVLLLLLFAGDYYDVVDQMEELEHYTIIFNTFVFMQLFNEINSRRVNREMNVFQNLFSNWLFSAVIIGTIGVQIIMVELAGDFASTTGLAWDRWLVCIALGFGALPWGALQRLIPVNYEFGEIELDPDTFEGAHFGNTLYDQQRPSSRDIHKQAEKSNAEPLMASAKAIEMV